MSEQPEVLKLVDALLKAKRCPDHDWGPDFSAAAALVGLHAQCERMREALEAFVRCYNSDDIRRWMAVRDQAVHALKDPQ